MTLTMPHDVVDTEVYIKTTRGHSGIQMDPGSPPHGERPGTCTTPQI